MSELGILQNLEELDALLDDGPSISWRNGNIAEILIVGQSGDRFPTPYGEVTVQQGSTVLLVIDTFDNEYLILKPRHVRPIDNPDAEESRELAYADAQGGEG